MVKLLVVFFIMDTFIGGTVIMHANDYKRKVNFNQQFPSKEENNRCQPLTIPLCQQLGYNYTRINNNLYFGEPYHYIADKYLSLFQHESTCSKDLLFLVCTLFNPICFKDFLPQIKPCRSVCEKVKRDCAVTMQKLFLPWPAFLNCNELPNYESSICIKPKSLVQREFSTSVKPKDEQPKKCRACGKLRELTRFGQFRKSGYAIEARFLSKTTTFNGRLKLQFKVNRIFKSNLMQIKKHDVIDIWVKSTCLCQSMEYDRSYILIGRIKKIDESNELRFLLNRKTIVLRKNRHYVQVLKRWAKQLIQEDNQ